MNHDKLRDATVATLLNIYKVLYEEYKNEQKSKKETFKIVSHALKDFGAVSDLYETIILLNKRYEGTKNITEKSLIREKLSVINNAIKIMEEFKEEF